MLSNIQTTLRLHPTPSFFLTLWYRQYRTMNWHLFDIVSTSYFFFLVHSFYTSLTSQCWSTSSRNYVYIALLLFILHFRHCNINWHWVHIVPTSNYMSSLSTSRFWSTLGRHRVYNLCTSYPFSDVYTYIVHILDIEYVVDSK